MEKSVSAPPAGLPARIFTGHWQGGHIQGIALDRQRKHLYCSFTTELVKLDLQGNLIGTVEGLTGHLGCLCLGPDGRIYGSLEYKNDAIGQGIPTPFISPFLTGSGSPVPIWTRPGTAS